MTVKYHTPSENEILSARYNLSSTEHLQHWHQCLNAPMTDMLDNESPMTTILSSKEGQLGELWVEHNPLSRLDGDPCPFEFGEPFYNEDGTLAGHVFEPTPEYKAVCERWLVPFILKKPDFGRKVIRKVVNYWGMDFIQYTPAPDEYTLAEGETIVYFKDFPKSDDSGPTISEVSIPFTSQWNNFPTKF